MEVAGWWFTVPSLLVWAKKNPCIAERRSGRWVSPSLARVAVQTRSPLRALQILGAKRAPATVPLPAGAAPRKAGFPPAGMRRPSGGGEKGAGGQLPAQAIRGKAGQHPSAAAPSHKLQGSAPTSRRARARAWAPPLGARGWVGPRAGAPRPLPGHAHPVSLPRGPQQAVWRASARTARREAPRVRADLLAARASPGGLKRHAEPPLPPPPPRGKPGSLSASPRSA